MSDKLRPSQFADAKGIFAEGFQRNIGVLAEGAAVPADGVAGYEEGCLFFHRAGAAGAQLYVNEGTSTSCAFKALPSQVNQVANPVAGVAAGYKIARGQHVQAAAADTIVTGLATVVSVVAQFDSAPTVKQFMVSSSIGDQAGSPAAGSIIISTFKPTNNTNDVTPIPATDFTDNLKINWIAIGT